MNPGRLRKLRWREVTELPGDQVLLRPIERADAPTLKAILATPEVAAWWGREDEGFPFDDEPEAVRFSILVDGEVAGLIQFVEETTPDYRHAGIDLYLAPAHQNRGFGTDAVATLARHLFEERGHHRLTIDPAAHNAAAIRCYEKAGFRRVGVMRSAWRDPDGHWRDALFMELVRLPPEPRRAA
jgi:aminoglycoside 6'-N-acetyltransferase